MKKTFLHVGCGQKSKNQTTSGFAGPDWNELRLDVDSSVNPDVVGSMLEMTAIKSHSIDAIYSSHNIEHLYPHEVPVALEEFKRVLRPDGFVVVTCPDLDSVCAAVVEGGLTKALYTSPAGPIAPIDILFGHRASLQRGNLYMAHRSGFTESVLSATFQAAGFGSTATVRRKHPYYDLWLVACMKEQTQESLAALVRLHFPSMLKIRS
jgi:ubiquinone/menaquinone biosynthesis C-methylase UbiE